MGPWAFSLLVALGCEGVAEEQAPERDPPPVHDQTPQAKIVAFGDSLTAGLGIGLDEAYPAALQDLLDEAGYVYEVVNAGVSGDTSAGGVRRLDWVLEGRVVEVLILALGANDGLRGLPPSEMKKNLADIIERAKSRGIRVLLAGFEAPPDSRDQYLQEFVSVFPELAREHEVALLPSFLEGVAGVSELNQEDGKHPNAKGARVLARNVFRALEPLLAPREQEKDP
jgi:acyl-CoA thioesterase-1